MGIVETLSTLLECDGFEVKYACDGKTIIDMVKAEEPDLLVLDWNLPEADGLTVCTELRQSGVDTPIMLLTARGSEADKVRAFSAGADDYVTKPFSLIEFESRVKALLRRSRLGSTQMQMGDLVIDLASHTVTLAGEALMLTPKEYSLLTYLAEHVNTAITRETLLKRVWGYDFCGNTRTVDVHVSRLRSKLGDDNNNPTRILTVKSVGYKLVPVVAATLAETVNR